MHASKHLLATWAKLVSLTVITLIAVALYISIAFPAQAQVAPTSADLQLALTRCGLDAKSLTAAGLSANDVASVVADAKQFMTEHPGSLTNADSSLANARQTADSLQRKIQSGQATEQEVSLFPGAQSGLNSATVARQAAVDAIFNAGAADLAQIRKDTLNRIRANKAQWELPMEYLVAERTEAQWVALRDALANERISAAHNQEPDPSATALLVQVRAEPAVSSASANLVANIAAVTAAWTQAANSQ